MHIDPVVSEEKNFKLIWVDEPMDPLVTLGEVVPVYTINLWYFKFNWVENHRYPEPHLIFNSPSLKWQNNSIQDLEKQNFILLKY